MQLQTGTLTDNYSRIPPFDETPPGDEFCTYILSYAPGVTGPNYFSQPWLLSNIIDSTTSKIPEPLKEYEIFERGGVRIGVIGLVEECVGMTIDIPRFTLAPAIGSG